MSYNNHDRDDPNAVKYSRAGNNRHWQQEGPTIKIYVEANTKPLGDFIKWMENNYSIVPKNK